MLLDFWASWCTACIVEFPQLREAYERFAKRGFEILGMNCDKPEDLQKAREIVLDRVAFWPQAMGPAPFEIAYKRLRIEQWPTKILLDRDGRFRKVFFGPTDLAELEKLLSP